VKILTRQNADGEKRSVADHLIPLDVSKNLDLVFPSNLLRVGNGREAVKQRRPSRSVPGVSRGTVNRKGCGACWNETSREKGTWRAEVGPMLPGDCP
jgi:hypothetical protein